MTYNFILGYVNKTRGLFSHYPAMLPENIHLLAHSCLHYVQTENGNILFLLGLPQKKELKNSTLWSSKQIFTQAYITSNGCLNRELIYRE